MISESTYNKLVDLYRTNEWAPYFFEELSLMRAPRGNIDIERRKMAINLRHGLRLTRTLALEFFSNLEAARLGKMVVIKKRGEGNSHFEWTDHTQRCFEVAKEVIDRAKVRPASQRSKDKGETFICRLQSGVVLRLSRGDLVELQDFIKSVL